MYIARIKIDFGSNNKNEYYKKDKWIELFKYKDKTCNWRMKENGIIEFIIGNYEDRFQALNDGKILYFNILYDLHRNEHGFKLGDASYITKMYHEDREYTLEKFVQNEEWFFSDKKNRANFLGLEVYEIDEDISDYDKYYEGHNFKITAINNEPFKFLDRITKLDKNYKYSKKCQEIFNLVRLSEKADEKTEILLLCQALETMGINEYKSNEEIKLIDECIKKIESSELLQEQKESIKGMLQAGKQISSRKKCKKLMDQYCNKNYKTFDKNDVFTNAYNLRSQIIHGVKLDENTDFSCVYNLKLIVLDILKEWSKTK